MSHKSVLQECPVPRECPIRVSQKSFLLECSTRVSQKSVPQECPTSVSCKSVPQEFPTRVTHKSVPQECHLDICSLSNVFAFGFVGSIFFHSKVWKKIQSVEESRWHSPSSVDAQVTSLLCGILATLAPMPKANGREEQGSGEADLYG